MLVEPNYKKEKERGKKEGKKRRKEKEEERGKREREKKEDVNLMTTNFFAHKSERYLRGCTIPR